MSLMMGLVTVIAVVNVIAFAVYGVDKNKAIKNQWRIPESTLLLISFFGPWGGMLGMNVFRHKTQKPKFKLVYIFGIIHLMVVAFFLLS